MLRDLMLKAASQPRLVRVFAFLGRWSGLTRRFIAGETTQEAIQLSRQLNTAGILVTLDLLGEGVKAESEAEHATAAYCRLLRRVHESGVQSSISIKLTQLGLDVSPELCEKHLRQILKDAAGFNNFVRIDMESSTYTQATIDLFESVYRDFGKHVGIVIQAYLFRSETDVRDLSSRGCNIRLCKGAYREPPHLAFPRKKDVDENFKKLAEIMLSSPAYSAIATHDLKMIRHARRFIRKAKIPESKYEFQMLYGIRRELQQQLLRRGHRVRIYVPFGTQWASYFMRRLAERPANLLFILRSLFGK